ncbi:hypothetical protein LXA43DRAFT_1088512 [Ganoderma leucocontextum]|nr:hypothetical protein LXA43DRAFT_1088512 [Ganoderma leucocontextum]
MKHLVVRSTSPEARNLILQLIRKNETPLTVQELYTETMRYQEENLKLEGTSSEPEQDYVIPSMRYLKKVVLPDLEQKGEVEKVHIKRSLSAEDTSKLPVNVSKGKKTSPVPSNHWLWLWQLKAHVPGKPPKPEKKPFGVEVGVGEDWSHLNKRRQRARQEKVGRDVQWVRELAKAEAEAKGEASS